MSRHSWTVSTLQARGSDKPVGLPAALNRGLAVAICTSCGDIRSAYFTGSVNDRIDLSGDDCGQVEADAALAASLAQQVDLP